MSHDIEITVKLNEEHLRAMLECFPPAFLGSMIMKQMPSAALADKVAEAVRADPSIAKRILENLNA